MLPSPAGSDVTGTFPDAFESPKLPGRDDNVAKVLFPNSPNTTIFDFDSLELPLSSSQSSSASDAVAAASYAERPAGGAGPLLWNFEDDNLLSPEEEFLHKLKADHSCGVGIWLAQWWGAPA